MGYDYKKYYNDHKDDILAYQKNYNKHSDKYRTYQKMYYLNHKHTDSFKEKNLRGFKKWYYKKNEDKRTARKARVKTSKEQKIEIKQIRLKKRMLRELLKTTDLINPVSFNKPKLLVPEIVTKEVIPFQDVKVNSRGLFYLDW